MLILVVLCSTGKTGNCVTFNWHLNVQNNCVWLTQCNKLQEWGCETYKKWYNWGKLYFRNSVMSRRLDRKKNTIPCIKRAKQEIQIHSLEVKVMVSQVIWEKLLEMDSEYVSFSFQVLAFHRDIHSKGWLVPCENRNSVNLLERG